MSYMDGYEHLEIQLKDIKAATNDFSDKPIGTGGFGNVYKAELILDMVLTVVAAKRLDRIHGQGDVEFWKEITMLSELKHENLACLLHFCSEDDERILIYKYASRGSLDRYLGYGGLTWTQRLKICIGAARGIAYLHDPNKTHQGILHRDIKSANILLDDDWTAQVSDFGLSKIGPANLAPTYLVSNIAGTSGYCDPEYLETGILSKECDVYSFGVVLFEVMCGRLCFKSNNGKSEILVGMWKKHFEAKNLDDIICHHLRGKIDPQSLFTFAAIANQCLLEDRKTRPSMVDIVRELEIALDHQQKFRDKEILNDAEMPVSIELMEKFHENSGNYSFLCDEPYADDENYPPSFVGMGGLSFADMPSSYEFKKEYDSHSDIRHGNHSYTGPNLSDTGLPVSRKHSNVSNLSGGEAYDHSEINQEDYVGISLVKKFKEVHSVVYFGEEDEDEDEDEDDLD